MTTLNIDLENARVFSLMSEQVHFASCDGKEYMCYAGLIVPKAAGYAVALWAITHSKKYSNLFDLNSDLQREIRSLNTCDSYLSRENQTAIVWYLVKKMIQCMKSWESQQFENLFS